VYLARDIATSRQMACKIVDIDAAAKQLTETSEVDVVGEQWHDWDRRLARGRDLAMREIRILSKLSHVRVNLQSSSHTNTI
jgi:hypothetical protein